MIWCPAVLGERKKDVNVTQKQQKNKETHCLNGVIKAHFIKF